MTLTACDVYGQKFTISHIFREAPNVCLDGRLQPGVSIRETVLRRPIYFGQKDLSSTGEDFETDLVEKLVGEKLRILRDKIETQRNMYVMQQDFGSSSAIPPNSGVITSPSSGC
ncbi:TPA: hypothetical protein ACSG64_005021 [Escherichia coli]|nr:hypothetical protein [Escherichia albertii]